MLILGGGGVSKVRDGTHFRTLTEVTPNSVEGAEIVCLQS